MDIAAQQILGCPAQHLLGGAVDKGCLALGVDAVDAFARRVQDQLVLPFQFGKEPLGAFPFGQARALQFRGLGDLGPAVKGVEVEQQQQHQPGTIRQHSRAHFAAQGRFIPVPKRHVAGPALPAMIDLFDKHDETGQVRPEMVGESHRPVRRHPEKPCRRRVEADKPVLRGVQQDGGLGQGDQQGIRDRSAVVHAARLSAATQHRHSKFRKL